MKRTLWSQSPAKPAQAQLNVEPVEKVFKETYLSNAEKSDIVEFATIKISSLGGVRQMIPEKPVFNRFRA
jgi:hypothetical protein